MNNEMVVALVGIVTSGVVGVAGIGFNFWNSSKEKQLRLDTLKLEQEERYRIGSFEKRLQVHQEAYNWLMQLMELLRNILKEDFGENSLFHTTLQQRSHEVRRWWDANCLYLDEASRAAVVNFIEMNREVAYGEWEPSGLDPRRSYRDALRLVQEGIGMKHLPLKERGFDAR